MQVSVTDPVFQTVVFSAVLLIAVLLSIRKRRDDGIFPIPLTNELKGLAIMMVVLSHVGYFLSTDTRFLFPLTIFAGVGVNLFLFLSGYGLAASSLKRKLSVGKFYLKRVLKVFIPLWITIAAFALLDRFVLGVSWPDLPRYFLGYFPTNDIFNDFNSPLWFITLIVFYYLVFPWLFSAKRPKLSALAVFVAGLAVTRLALPVSDGVAFFYRLHIAAFPLGMLTAALLRRPYFFEKSGHANLAAWLDSFSNPLIKRLLDLFRRRTGAERGLSKSSTEAWPSIGPCCRCCWLQSFISAIIPAWAKAP